MSASDEAAAPGARPDRVFVRGLEVFAAIGVPDAERRRPQRLEVDVEIIPAGSFATMADDVARTVDYSAVARRVRAEAAVRPRRLIETLADELAALLLAEFSAAAVTVEIRKFVLPRCAHVAVRAERSREA